MVRLPNGLLLRHRRAANPTPLLTSSTSSLPRRAISTTTPLDPAPAPRLDKGKRPEAISSTRSFNLASAPGHFAKNMPRSLPVGSKADVTDQADADQDAPKPKAKRGRKPKAEGSSAASAKGTKSRSKATADTALVDPEGPFPHLPKQRDWRNVFKFGSGFLKGWRYFVSNPETAATVVDKLELGKGWPAKTPGGEEVGWTVIEAYAGPGTLTSHLLAHPAVDKVISMEDNESFAAWLSTLKESDVATSPKHHRTLVDPKSRLQVIRGSAYHWDSYNLMLDEGALSHLQGRIAEKEGQDGAVQTVDFGGKLQKKEHEGPGWETISPLLFVAQLPNTVHGEQLFAQIIHAIASRMWLFQYGRVKMAFFCAETLALRSMAQPGERQRGKLSVTVQSLCDVSLTIPSADLAPHHEHFYPSTPSVGPRLPLSSNQIIPRSAATEGSDASKEKMCMMVIEPKAKPLVGRTELEAFEYVTRNVFILRSRSVEEALKHVAPGAANILAHLQPDSPSMAGRPKSECVDPSTLVSQLTNDQWVGLARVFEKWPFRPQNLFEEGRIDTSVRGFMR